MPCNYKRKTKTNYSLEDLKSAIDDVKSKKLSMDRAAETYNILKTILFDHLKKEVPKQPRSGRKPLFIDEQKMQLVDYIIKYSKLYCGLIIKQFAKLRTNTGEKQSSIQFRLGETASRKRLVLQFHENTFQHISEDT